MREAKRKIKSITYKNKIVTCIDELEEDFDGENFISEYKKLQSDIKAKEEELILFKERLKIQKPIYEEVIAEQQEKIRVEEERQRLEEEERLSNEKSKILKSKCSACKVTKRIK